ALGELVHGFGEEAVKPVGGRLEASGFGLGLFAPLRAFLQRPGGGLIALILLVEHDFLKVARQFGKARLGPGVPELGRLERIVVAGVLVSIFLTLSLSKGVIGL